MITQITWQEFITFTVITGLLYYAVVLFLYYRGELINLIKIPPNRYAFNSSNDDLEDRNDQEILGKVISSDVIGSVNPIDLQFSGAETEEEQDLILEPIVNSETLIQEEKLEPSPDELRECGMNFISEFKGHLNMLKEADASKEEFCSLFLAITSKYHLLKDKARHEHINLQIAEMTAAEKLLFIVTTDDLEELWQESFLLS